jgi:hypothetical protein
MDPRRAVVRQLLPTTKVPNRNRYLPDPDHDPPNGDPSRPIDPPIRREGDEGEPSEELPGKHCLQRSVPCSGVIREHWLSRAFSGTDPRAPGALEDVGDDPWPYRGRPAHRRGG